MRILGIDPGYATTGFGILEAGRGSVQLLNYGTITTPTTLTFPAKNDGCENIRNRHQL